MYYKENNQLRRKKKTYVFFGPTATMTEKSLLMATIRRAYLAKDRSLYKPLQPVITR
jgi:hypothetical protein